MIKERKLTFTRSDPVEQSLPVMDEKDVPDAAVVGIEGLVASVAAKPVHFLGLLGRPVAVVSLVNDVQLVVRGGSCCLDTRDESVA